MQQLSEEERCLQERQRVEEQHGVEK
jgi:hypothetical protein